MRGPISEAVIIVILGFLIGGIAAAVVHFMIDSKWPPAAAPYAAIGSHATRQRINDVRLFEDEDFGVTRVGDRRQFPALSAQII